MVALSLCRRLKMRFAVEKPSPAAIAWGVLGVGVIGYDAFCPKGETLSEGVDRALESERGKYLALGAIAITAAHLANLLPERFDPLHHATKLKGIRDCIKDELYE